MATLSKPLMVAVVEDDPRIRQLIEDEVVDEGHRVDSFSTAEAFLEVFKAKRFDLVLLDLMLPGMNGLACLKAMTSQAGDRNPIPLVVMVTALNDSDMKRQTLEAGASDYILKPDLFVRLPELLQNLREAPATEPSR